MYLALRNSILFLWNMDTSVGFGVLFNWLLAGIFEACPSGSFAYFRAVWDSIPRAFQRWRTGTPRDRGVVYRLGFEPMPAETPSWHANALTVGHHHRVVFDASLNPAKCHTLWCRVVLCLGVSYGWGQSNYNVWCLAKSTTGVLSVPIVDRIAGAFKSNSW